jgi:predicted neuraminidase
MRTFWRNVRAMGSIYAVAVIAALLASESTLADDPAPKAGAVAVDQPKTISDAEVKPQPGVVSSEFVYETAPFPQCHATTIAETKSGLVTAWFGGTKEKHPDVGIWFSRHEGSKWTTPVELANGVQDATTRHPCWNPVLFQMPSGPLLLFYKVGPSPRDWWGMVIRSEDGGKTWSKPEKLPDDIPGPIKNKPILLADGRLLSGSSTEDHGWRVHMEWTKDAGKTWERTGVLCDGVSQGAIQPTILKYGDKLQILCRNRIPGPLWQSWSEDDGRTWSKLELTDLPHPGSGVDGVTLADGRQLLVYNHVVRGRSPLNVSVSSDGKKWDAALVLESQPGEYSYPAVIQSADGRVHITYTWKRQRVKHVIVDPAKLVLQPIVDSKWPQP